MKNYLISILLLFVMAGPFFGQTTIVVEAGPISYSGIKDIEVDDFTENISDCTSIQFSVEYSFSLTWEGSTMPSNMESADECGFGTCPGDPTDPGGGTCNNCWDFMWMQFFIGSTEVDTELIGDAGTTNAEQMGTYTSPIFCVDGETDAEIIITNQNWANAETNTFGNVTILCWEGVPDFTLIPTTCGGNLDLDGTAIDASVVTDWEWTNTGTGVIDDDSNQNTFATNVEDGEIYTLTTTDENNCTASVEQVASTAGGTFDAELLGSAELCVGQCSEGNDNMTISITGGATPYEVEITIVGFTVTIPGIDVDEEIQFCIEEGGLFPTVDNGSSPIQVTIPSAVFDIFNPLELSISSIIDDNGCVGNIMGGDYTLERRDNPEIFPADPLPECVDDPTAIDLTVYDDDILNGGPGVVIWIDDPSDVESDINDPENYDIDDGNPVWAVVFNDPCYSEVEEVFLDISVRPIIDVIEPSDMFCGFDYELPDFDFFVDITNASNPQYYLDDNLIDGPYNPSELLFVNSDTELFIYDESAPGCDAIESVFLLPVVEPEIISPSGTLSDCGSITLPDPNIVNEDDWQYNTEPDGSGTSYDEGDEIPSASGINLLYLIATNNEGCIDTTHVQLAFLSGVNWSATIDTFQCNTLELTMIMPPTTIASVGYYLTTTNTTGIPDFNAQDIITFGQTDVMNNPIDTLYLYDPMQMGVCATIDTLVFEIGVTNPVIPADVTSCGPTTLPNATTSNSALYYTDDLGNIIDAAEVFTTSTTVFANTAYVYTDGTQGCVTTNLINVNIVTDPDAGTNTAITICQGYDAPFNLMELLGFPDTGGQFSDSGIPDLDRSDSTAVLLSTAAVGSHSLFYTIEIAGCPPGNAEIEIEVVPSPEPGIDAVETLCNTSATYNLIDIFGARPDASGTWVLINNVGTTLPISDPTSVDLSVLPDVNQDGEITFNYVFPAVTDGPYCNEALATLVLNIVDAVDAGDDVSSTACVGQNIDLTTLLSPDADEGGTFESVDGSILLTGNNFNTGLIINIDPSYDINYIVSTPGCSADTSLLTVNLSGQLSAGIPTGNTTVCTGEMVLLDDFLIGQTPGGTFYIEGDFSTPIPSSWTPDQNTTFNYITPPANGCDPDTSTLTLDVVEALDFQATANSNTVCENATDCIALELVSNVEGTAILFFSDPLTLESADIEVTLTDGITIYNLCPSTTFNEPAITDEIMYLGASPQIEYSISNLTGTIPCQSSTQTINEVVIIAQSFTVDIDTTVCPGVGVIIDGIMYTQSETFNGLTTNGCDSIVNINIMNFQEPMETEDVTLCEGQAYPINGGQLTTAVADTMIRISGGAETGCDSIVLLTLNFEDTAVGNIRETLCDGESRIIDNIVFDVDNPSDTIPFVPGSTGGCDSITVVDFSFTPLIADTDIFLEFCGDQDTIIDGTVYDKDNLVDTYILQSITGCDSIVNILGVHFPEDVVEVVATQCTGQPYDYEGFTFTEDIDTTIILTDFAASGCDSIVNLQLTFQDVSSETIDDILCIDDSRVIEGILFDKDNTSDEITLPGGSVAGCDSLIIVDLTFQSQAVEIIDDALCFDEVRVIEGITFDINNPSDDILLPGASAGGCDSLIMVDFQFSPEATSSLEIELCQDEERIIGDMTYNANNLSGVATLDNAAASGCDSTVSVTVLLRMDDVVTDDRAFCEDQDILIGGQTFNQANPSGQVPLTNQFGCDSIINVALVFGSADVELSSRACPGDEDGFLVVEVVNGLSFPITMDIDGPNVGGGITATIDALPYEKDLPFGTYTINLSDGDCTSTQVFTIEPDPAALNVNVLSSMLDGNTFQLGLEQNINYTSITWTPAEVLDCADCDNPIATIEVPTAIQMALTTEDGCLFTVSTTLVPEGQEIDSTYRIFMPNVINSDDPSNNTYYIMASSDVTITALRIYDRWGNLVFINEDFLANDPANGWDGRRKGTDVEQGVYIYMVEYDDPSRGSTLEYGNLTVFR